VHGITYGAEFTVFGDEEARTNPLGVLETLHIDEYSTVMHHREKIPLKLPQTSRAVQTKAGGEEDLCLYVDNQERLMPIFQSLVEEMSHPGTKRRLIKLVEKEKAHLHVSLEEDSVIFNILNLQVSLFGLTRLPFSVKLTRDSIYPVCQASAHYHWHLRRNNAAQILQNHIQIELTKLVLLDEYDDDLNRIVKPVGENLNIRVLETAPFLETVLNPLYYVLHVISHLEI
jgi:hypothetical protein